MVELLTNVGSTHFDLQCVHNLQPASRFQRVMKWAFWSLKFFALWSGRKKLQQRWHLYAMRGSRHSLSPADVLPADLPKRECLWFETRRQLFERSNATLSQKVLGRLLVFMNHSICVFQQTHSRTSLVWSSFSSEVDCQRSERCRSPRTRLDCTSC